MEVAGEDSSIPAHAVVTDVAAADGAEVSGAASGAASAGDCKY